MAQHDYVIANGTGAAVRSDINNGLAAIVSNNSGATAPSTTYAYQWWADTTTGLLKLRNAANNAWITLFQLDGEWSTLAVENGTAAAPSIYFKDSGTDTGVYSPGTDQVAISTGGTVRLSLSTTAVSSALAIDHPLGAVGTPSITFTGDLNTGIYSPAADTLAFVEGGVEAMRIDSSGRVGIGTTAAQNTLHLHKSDGLQNYLQITNATTGSSATDGALFGLNDDEDVIVWQREAGALQFGTNNAERARIDSSGRLLVGTSSGSSIFDGITPQFQIEGTGYNSSSASLFANSNDANGAYLVFGKSRGTSTGSSTIVSSGDTIGGMYWVAADGTDRNTPAASIYALVDGTPGANDMPGRLVFSTTADGAASPSVSLQISNAGIHYLPRNYNGNNSSVLTANVFIFSDGSIGRYTSSGKYKTEIEDLDDFYADKILELRPTWYRSLCKRDNPDWSTYGFIAEEVAAVDPRLVHWKTVDVVETENGGTQEIACEPEAEGVNYTMMIPHLVSIIKRQKQQIEAMEARLAALEGV